MGNVECQLPPQNEGVGSKLARLLHIKPSKETEFSTYTLACNIKEQLIKSGKKKAFTPADEKELRDYAAQGLKHDLSAKQLANLYVIAMNVNKTSYGKKDPVTVERIIKTIVGNQTSIRNEMAKPGPENAPYWFSTQYNNMVNSTTDDDKERAQRILSVGQGLIGLGNEGLGILDKIAPEKKASF